LAFSIAPTFDNGYVAVGENYPFIKIDSLGAAPCLDMTVNTPDTSRIFNNWDEPITIAPCSFTTYPHNLILDSGVAIINICMSGIRENPNESISFQVSPNPTTNNFTITFPNIINKGVIEIYNVLGKKIFREDIINVSQKEIRFNTINAGIYFVKVRDGEKEYCKKLVIE
jgi:hypothetical protein